MFHWFLSQFSPASDRQLSHVETICGDMLSKAPRKTNITSFTQQKHSLHILLFIIIFHYYLLKNHPSLNQVTLLFCLELYLLYHLYKVNKHFKGNREKWWFRKNYPFWKWTGNKHVIYLLVLCSTFYALQTTFPMVLCYLAPGQVSLPTEVTGDDQIVGRQSSTFPPFSLSPSLSLAVSLQWPCPLPPQSLGWTLVLLSQSQPSGDGSSWDVVPSMSS